MIPTWQLRLAVPPLGSGVTVPKGEFLERGQQAGPCGRAQGAPSLQGHCTVTRGEALGGVALPGLVCVRPGAAAEPAEMLHTKQTQSKPGRLRVNAASFCKNPKHVSFGDLPGITLKGSAPLAKGDTPLWPHSHRKPRWQRPGGRATRSEQTASTGQRLRNEGTSCTS